MEDQREKLAESIRGAFDKWGFQFYLKRIGKKGRILKKIKEEMRYEDLFLSKRVFVLGFNRYVTSEVYDSNVMQKQKPVLLRAVLQSIIYEEGIQICIVDHETISISIRCNTVHIDRTHSRNEQAFKTVTCGMVQLQNRRVMWRNGFLADSDPFLGLKIREGESHQKDYNTQQCFRP